MMKFNYVIGNPPYQEEVKNEGDRANPVYNLFMDVAFQVADTVELIHPARFLFRAGQTPKQWNEKMLQDTHFKILYYEPDASKVFPNTEIKGGIVVSLRDANKEFGAIEVFTAFDELNSIVRKVTFVVGNAKRLNSIIASQGLYRFSPLFFNEHPEAVTLMGSGTGNKIVSSIIDKLPEVFLDEASDDGREYVHFMGRIRNQRLYRFIRRDYLAANDYIDTYNLFIPEANNSGVYGETLTEPTIGYSGDGASDTFLSAGKFSTIDEPVNLSKYMKTKFFRALLGVKKVTQHCPPAVWEMIPLQDFTPASDIDWSRSIHEIDQQLYRKYGLNDDEISFIETHVKEMT